MMLDYHGVVPELGFDGLFDSDLKDRRREWMDDLRSTTVRYWWYLRLSLFSSSVPQSVRLRIATHLYGC